MVPLLVLALVVVRLAQGLSRRTGGKRWRGASPSRRRARSRISSAASTSSPTAPGGDRPDPVDEWGLSDIQYQAYISPQDSGSVVWGIGPVLQVPTATDALLGTEQWRAGPGLVALQMNGPWVYGSLNNNIWSFSGDSDRADVNLMFAQPFVNYNLGKGAAIGTVPQITANWEADGSDVWTVPLGVQVSKVKPIGSLPINWILGGYYNVARPDNAADWTLRLQVQFLFPQ